MYIEASLLLRAGTRRGAVQRKRGTFVARKGAVRLQRQRKVRPGAPYPSRTHRSLRKVCFVVVV